MNDNIKRLLKEYSLNTVDINVQLKLAKAYYDLEQYASAMSYINRVAEMSDDKDIIYESLLLGSQCFFFQGDRNVHTKVCLNHAVTVLPERPEAYYLLCKMMEIEEPFDCYMYACIAINYKNNAKRVTNLPFDYEHYRVLFQKAANGWHAQKIEEAKEIFYDLHLNHEMDSFYTDLVINNLNGIGWPERKEEIKTPKLNLVDDKPKWKVTDYPTLEITTVIPVKGCVVDCVFCPQEILKKSYNDEMRFMTVEDFKKAIDKVPTEVRIIFSGFIEPFMNKYCTDMMLYAYEKGHPIAVFTTAVGMTLEDVERIKHIPFENGPNGGFTLHLPDKEHLAKHPITEKYKDVLQAIKDANLSSFYLMSMGEVHDEIEKLNIWKKEDVHVPQMWSRAGNLKGEAQMKPELRRVAGRVSDAGKYNSKEFENVELTCGCIEDLYHNILLPNGDVSLCCMDYGLKHITGNLYEQSYNDSIPDNNESFDLCRTCENAIPCSDKSQNNLYEKTMTGEVKEDGYQNLKQIIEEEPETIIQEQPEGLPPIVIKKWGGDTYDEKKGPIVNKDCEPTIVVVDNFLDNPDEVRQIALDIPKEEWQFRGSVGLRSNPYPNGEVFRPIFEKLLNIKTNDIEWNGGGTHGCYQYGDAETRQVAHCDATDWAGIIFLTPDAPPRTGTWLLKHKGTGKRYRDEGLDDCFEGNQRQFDVHPFEMIDDIGNVYNRLILWNGRHLHTAGSYFGEGIDGSRLYQVFFFNEKK